MSHIEMMIAAFRSQYCQEFALLDYLEAGAPFSDRSREGKGAEIWVDYGQGTTVN